VINFDLPRSPADYMHRIGRSGRAGEVGLGISLLDYEDFHHFKVIEKKNKFRLEREQIEGFEIDEEVTAKLAADFLAQQKPTAPAPGTGKKKRNKKRSMDKINPEANSGLWSGFSKK